MPGRRADALDSDRTLTDVVGAVFVWLVSAGAVSARLWSMGPTGRSGALVVAVAAVAAEVVLRAVRVHPAARYALVAAFGLVASVLTVPNVGRFPVVVMLGSLVVADLAVFGVRTAGRDRSPVALAVPVLVVNAVVWWWLGSNGVALALLALAALSIALVWAGVPAALRLNDRIASPVVAVGDSIRRAASSLRDGVAALARDWWMPEHRWVLLPGLIVAFASAPIFWRLVADPEVFIRGTNDMNSGIPRIEWIQFWPPRMSVAHPVYFTLIRVLSPTLGILVSSTAVAATATGAAVAVLIAVGRSWFDDERRLGWVGAWALGLGFVLLESPAVLIPRTSDIWGRFEAAGSFARGTSYAALHQWATPTIVMSMPFVFALFWTLLAVLRQADDDGAGARRTRWILAVLTVFLALLQPAVVLALIPAVPLWLLVTRRWTRRTVSVAARSFVVPGALVCLAQVVFLRSNVSPFEQATWLWRPFWVWNYYGLDRPAFWATLLFFPLCIWQGGRRYLRDPAVRLAAYGVLISIVPFLLLEQTTVADRPDGDLGVIAMMALVLLFMASLRFALGEFSVLLSRRREAGPTAPLPVRTMVLGGFLGIMLCAGVIDVLGAAGVLPEW
jgi:hypothetical protein